MQLNALFVLFFTSAILRIFFVEWKKALVQKEYKPANDENIAIFAWYGHVCCW